MTAEEIIAKFETYVDDATELSSDDELALLQKVYNKVFMNRPWEFSKDSATSTISYDQGDAVYKCALPARFSYLIENNQTTDNSIGIDNNAAAKVVYVGTDYKPFQIINWSDRRRYLNKTGYCYRDNPSVGSRVIFTGTPTLGESCEFDYILTPDTLALDDEPAFPAQFHDILYHGMAVDDDIILRFPKAQSYAQENQAKFDSYLRDMAYWNANLLNN